MTRRAFVAGALGAFLAGCTSETQQPRLRTVAPRSTLGAASSSPTPPPPTPTPPWEGSSTTRTLLQDTESATSVVIHDSGRDGPAALVLGGAHGNEPGSWLAAEALAEWLPHRGVLLVVPRVNPLAIDAFERTLEGLGDPNRLYPGDSSSDLPMERMVAELLELGREFAVDLLLDLHESWGFAAEYPPAIGYATIGQTITTGPGPLFPGFGAELASRVNPLFSQREQMLLRDGEPYRRPRVSELHHPVAGRSSLAAGGFVDGLTPVLVEMGQEDQPVERRTELHRIVARTSLEILGMF